MGSGIKKIAKYSRIYSNGAQPTFRDDETFIASIPLCNEINNNDIDNNKLKELILSYIKSSLKNGRTRREINNYIYPLMNEELRIKNSKVRTTLTSLRKNNLIENIGSDTKPIWIIK